MGTPTIAETQVNNDDGDIDMTNYPTATASAYPEEAAPAPAGASSNTASYSTSANTNPVLHHNGSVEPTFYESALMAATNGTQYQQQQQPPQVWGASVVPPPQPTEVPIWQQPKQGSKCCGCCCDFRRAVIIINSVIISFSTYSLLMLFNRPADMEQLWGEVINDDQVLNELGDIEDDGYMSNAIISGIAMLATIVPIYGAYRFDNRLIGFGLGFLILSFVTRITVAFILIEKANDVSENVRFAQPNFLYTLYTIVVALFVYAHVGLMLEIRHGIMSPETYPREDYSCCCMSRPPAGFFYGQQPAYPATGQAVVQQGAAAPTAYPTATGVGQQQLPGAYSNQATPVPGQRIA